MFENEVSNSGGADDGLINPAGFIVRAGDLDTSAITAAATGVAGIGTSVVTAVDSVSTAWTTVKSPGVFETPDAGAVYTLMDPAVAGAADMNGVTSRISSALETYAAELEAIKPDLEDLEEDAWDFRAKALAGYEVSNLEAYGPLAFVTLATTTTVTTSPGIDPTGTTTISWQEHEPAVAKNAKLIHRFEAILARVSTAATTCANLIQGELQLVCAAPFDAITAEALANSPEFSTWGAAVSEQRNVSESIGFGLANFGKGIWTGGELITGYDAQTGVRSWDTFWKTVGGLGDFVGSTLAVTNVPFMIAGIASMGTNTPFRNFFTDRINTVASSWGSIIGWDQQAHLAGENGWHKWEEDGIAAATESVANVGTFFIPVANIGKVVVVGTKVGSFVVRGVAGVAEFVIPAGSHLVTGVVKVVELTSTGVKTGFRGLIDAIRDTHINVTVKPTTVPGTLNTALDITHLDTPVRPGTAVSDALGLETVKIKPDVPDVPVDTTPHSSVDVKPDVPEPVRPAEPVDGGGTKPQYDPDAPVSKTVNQADSPGGKGSYSNQDIIDAYNRAPVNEQGVPVDHRTGEPLYPDGENGRGWHMKWDPNAEKWVAENPGLGPGESGYLPPRVPENIWNDYQDALRTDPTIDPPYGYDHNGNRLPYANYRPPVSDRTVREVWWEAVKRWVIDDGAAEVRVTDINDLEVDVRWENNSSYRDILDQLKTRIDEFADGKITEADYEAAIKELEDQFLNDTSPLPTRDGIWDMGHTAEQKYSILRDLYLNHKLDPETFIKRATEADSFLVEDPLRNRSHTDEPGGWPDTETDESPW